MANNTRTYIDLDLSFRAHPATGDITVKLNEEAVKASIRNLILTGVFERPFQSSLGSKLKSLLFEPISPFLYGIIKKEIVNMISAYEPRAELLDVQVIYIPDENSIGINIIFRILGTSIVSNTNIVLERTR